MITFSFGLARKVCFGMVSLSQIKNQYTYVFYVSFFGYMKRTKPKAIGRKRRERIENGGSEVDVFRKVRIRADGYCEITRVYINEPKSYCFAHILPKGTWPEYRLDPNNIIYVATRELHGVVDYIKSGMWGEMEEMVKQGTAISFIRDQYYACYPKRQNTE